MKKKIVSIIFISILLVLLLTGCTKEKTVYIKIIGDKTNFESEYKVTLPTIINSENLSDDEYLSKIKSINETLYIDVKNILQNELIKPVNSEITFDKFKDNPFTISNDISGKKVNVQMLYNDLISSLSYKNIVLNLNYEDIQADITFNSNTNITSLRGGFTTNYSKSSVGRKHNIELAVSRINGQVIMPDSELSFNKIVGKRSIANGFKEATIIADGNFVKGVGGGICQVSTTLYNAFLLSDLTVTEARQHSLPIRYVEPSFDAMVSSWSDLKVKNTSVYPIYLVCHADGDIIDVKVYGEKLDYEIKRVSNITKVVPYKVEVKLEGENKRGKNGIKSTGKLVYYNKQGLKVKEKTIREDYYMPQNEIIVSE